MLKTETDHTFRVNEQLKETEASRKEVLDGLKKDSLTLQDAILGLYAEEVLLFQSTVKEVSKIEDLESVAAIWKELEKHFLFTISAFEKSNLGGHETKALVQKFLEKLGHYRLRAQKLARLYGDPV